MQAAELNYTQTHLRESADYVEDWPVNDGARFRRIGWLDQRGRIWTTIPPQQLAWDLGCGSFTPLLFVLDD